MPLPIEAVVGSCASRSPDRRHVPPGSILPIVIQIHKKYIIKYMHPHTRDDPLLRETIPFSLDAAVAIPRPPHSGRFFSPHSL